MATSEALPQGVPEKKAKTDWEKVEKLYRLGQLSVREIARQHDIQASTITRRAKKDGWAQDLSELIRQKSNATLLSNSNATPPTRADIDVAVATVVGVVREHRKDISTGRGIVQLLMGQLIDAANSREDLELAIEEETAGDKSGERRNKLMRAVSIPTHASTVRDLSTAMKNLIGLERQAFNIGDAPDAPPEPATSDQVTEGFADMRAAFEKRLANGETPC